MFNDLDPILHSQVRLAVMSVLISVKTAEFSFLLEATKTTKGNLSFQLNKLKEAGYIEIRKSLKGNYPLTKCNITDKGADAFEVYVNAISGYFKEFINPEEEKWKVMNKKAVSKPIETAFSERLFRKNYSVVITSFLPFFSSSCPIK